MRLISVLVAVLVPVAVIAQPSVTGVAGSLDDGASITISGSSFGSKSQAAPFKWDDLTDASYDAYSNGDAVPEGAGYPWSKASTIYGSQVYFKTDTTRVAGKKNYQALRGQVGVADLSLSGDDQVIYINWWVRANRNLRDQGNGVVFNKLLRVWTDGGGDNGRTSWEDNFTMYWSNDGDGTHTESNEYYPQFLTDFEWHNVEAIIYSQTISATGGGRIELWVDNDLIAASGNNVASSIGPYDYVWMIGSDPHDYTRYNPDTRMYWCDIYIDSTLSRVAIGNAPVYANSTHNEIQIPSAWSSSSITATVNVGSYDAGDQLYLYVIDSSGSASAGYPITIGSTSGNPSAPGRPQNMSAVER